MMAAQSRKSLLPFAVESDNGARAGQPAGWRPTAISAWGQLNRELQVPVTALLSSLPTGKQGKERPAEIELIQLNREHEKEEAPSRTQIDAMFHKPFLAIEQCNQSSSA